ncbi:MAG: bifunctional (p)ppGpp synthetase/guanosine-3',5'-bis(diphosphate) 3'-pyrophosphohydrolase [Acidiferrobacterales bacterium]|nr:bifunctional (p)ppGpp synthetase/guanosine-3',5'-bis(diphosphate) 3'-pyrophosphohydrolase [Acidiferrobacterales bacterium]
MLISDLCEVLETYLEPDDIKVVYQAYLFGSEAHNGQTRRSGEPYIHHPLEVAYNLASMHLDARSIVAAILHDVIEDTENSKEQIASEFGEDVAELVDGVSKINQIEFSSKEEEQAENFRKMLLAMTRDIRVILIKLADRLHNMRTLGAMPRYKQRIIARETLDIYAPIANRLGVRQWAVELEELAFKTLYPLRYRVLDESIRKRHGNRKAVVDKVKAGIIERLEQEGVEAEVQGREKHIYSTYRKMQQKRLSFEQVLDVYAFRIVVDSVDNCYRVLGIVHNLYKPIPGRFKDYIAIPKANGYQSLHTVVFGPFGVSIEIQIRTEAMHRVAEAGVAAHWLYKSVDTTGDKHAHQRALQWLQELLELQQKAGNPGEFLEHLKVDLFPDEVYVFTPNGEIKKMPRGATVIDFAYDVHTDVGNHCLGARVDHRLVPLRTQLRNGNHVEILTSEWSRPNPSWLDHVVTGKARANIRNYLKQQRRGEAVSLGERMLDKALQSLGSSMSKLDKETRERLVAELKFPSWNELMSEIGLGNRQAALVARQLLPSAKSSKKEEGTVDGGVLAITGTEGVVVTYAKCCRPIPGDAILGFLSAGRGIVVHTEDCPNVAEYKKHPERWIDVQWEKQIDATFPVNLRIDTRNQRGVLANVASAISELEANIDSVSFEERDGQSTSMYFVIEVKDRDHLAQVLRAVRNKDMVVRATRTKG